MRYRLIPKLHYRRRQLLGTAIYFRTTAPFLFEPLRMAEKMPELTPEFLEWLRKPPS